MKTKRILAVCLTAVLLVVILPLASHAAIWGQGDTLDDALSELMVGFDNTRLDWLCLPGMDIIYLRYTYFQFKNERTGQVDEHPVYCIDPAKGGAYEIVQNVGPNSSDGSNTATYIRGTKVGDAKYVAIIANGYPHMRLDSLGLQSREEAYYATKLALWMYIRGNDPSKLTFNPAYGDSDPVAQRVRNAAISVYNNAMKASPPREAELRLTGKPNAITKLDASGQFFVQEVEVYSSGWIGNDPSACGDVQLAWDSPPPAGTIVLGTSGEDITSSLAVTVSNTGTGYFGGVTIKYPVAAVDPSFKPPTLTATATLANSDMYVAYAQADKDRYQRYLVEADPKINLDAEFDSEVEWLPEEGEKPPTPSDPAEGKLEIVKLEYGTTNRLDGAEFEVTRTSHWERRLVDPDEDDTGEFYDDDNGGELNSGDPGYHHNVEDLADDVWEWIEVHEIEYVGTYSTVNGTVSLDVAPGSFEVRELTPPSGFVLDENNVKKVDVPLEGGAVTLTYENKRLPTLTIRKYDELTNAPLAGASFRLWKSESETWSETLVTDSGGAITWTDLEPGVYSVLETDEPYGYFRDPARKEVLLEAGDNKQLEFFNRPRPVLIIHKRDYVTGEPLANFKFRVQ
ncbi:MAG: Cys-Gln thioester bond-forming surface protein, partial [Oscillospiraceae bacterium]|nr:Cys-Gln thioester bond-forming surface protein [Oscillospiraceae bacterium]